MPSIPMMSHTRQFLVIRNYSFYAKIIDNEVFYYKIIDVFQIINTIFIFEIMEKYFETSCFVFKWVVAPTCYEKSSRWDIPHVELANRIIFQKSRISPSHDGKAQAAEYLLCSSCPKPLKNYVLGCSSQSKDGNLS